MISRFRSAATVSGMHLLASMFVAACCAALVFLLWYPFPYFHLVGGKELFLLMVMVDVVCGPLLTLFVFSPLKSRAEILLDIGLIVALQVGALAYGLYSVVQARPVFLAFEGDQFKVVSLPDVQLDDISSAPEGLRKFSYSGPVLIGVKLIASGGISFLQSVELDLQGVAPAFRPSRWVDFSSQSKLVVNKAKPLADLRTKHPARRNVIEDAIERIGLSESELGYLPLSAGKYTDWVVIVSRLDGMPQLYLPLDGW